MAPFHLAAWPEHDLPPTCVTCRSLPLCLSLTQAVSVPDSDAYSPRFAAQAALAQGSDKFDNSTATLLFTVPLVGLLID